MSKYKIILIFSLGFILATAIGIYKQKRVANKANNQIAIANTVISNLQENQRELENLKRIINNDREMFRQEKYNYQLEIQRLQELIENQPKKECPSFNNPYQPKNGGEIWVIPPSFQIQLGGNTYNCKSR